MSHYISLVFHLGIRIFICMNRNVFITLNEITQRYYLEKKKWESKLLGIVVLCGEQCCH